MKLQINRFLFLILALFLLLAKPLAGAIPWQMEEYYYYAQSDNLKDLLRNFCQAQGINSVISDNVKGEASGFFQGIAPMDFLNQITKAYGLIWFYDGNILYIEPFDQIESRVLQTEYVEAVTILEVLDTLGIEGSNFSVRSLKNQGVTIISGAPRFVAMVEALINKLEGNEYARMGREGIEVFPLKHSWAYDLRFNYSTSNQSISTTASAALNNNTDELIIPGVATLLKGLMDSKASNTLGMNNNFFSAGLAQHTKMDNLNTRLEALKIRSRENNKGEGFAQEDYRLGSVNVDFSPNTMIEADKRLNAVVIKDVRSKMDMYRDLINALDQPVQVISISAAIVDVDKNYSRDLGTKFFNVNNTNGSWSGSISPDGSAKGVTQLTNGFNAQAQWPISPLSFLSQVQALEKEGNANILSRPFLLTLDNVEAVLTKDETFFVKLEGKDDVDLANVTVGTTLKVIPHVIEGENGKDRRIKLLVTISDGEPIENEVLKNVDGLPRTRKSTINTQAIIREGESLLIGGYFREAFHDSNNGVPILRSIPIVGQLFQSKLKKNSTIERMFLITPRVVELSSDEIAENNPEFRKHLDSWGKEKEAVKALKEEDKMRDVLEGKSWHGGLLDSSSPAKKSKKARLGRRGRFAATSEKNKPEVSSAAQKQKTQFLDKAVLQEDSPTAGPSETGHIGEPNEAQEGPEPAPFVVQFEGLESQPLPVRVTPAFLEDIGNSVFTSEHTNLEFTPLKPTTEALSNLPHSKKLKSTDKTSVETEFFEAPDEWEQASLSAIQVVYEKAQAAPTVKAQRPSFISDWANPTGLEEEPELFQAKVDFSESMIVAEKQPLEIEPDEVFEMPEAWEERVALPETFTKAIQKPTLQGSKTTAQTYISDITRESINVEEPELFQLTVEKGRPADEFVEAAQPTEAIEVNEEVPLPAAPELTPEGDLPQETGTVLSSAHYSAVKMDAIERSLLDNVPFDVHRDPNLPLALSVVDEIRETPESFIMLTEYGNFDGMGSPVFSTEPSISSLSKLIQDAQRHKVKKPKEAEPTVIKEEEVTQLVVADEETELTSSILTPEDIMDDDFEAFLAKKKPNQEIPTISVEKSQEDVVANEKQGPSGSDFWDRFDDLVAQIPVKKSLAHSKTATETISNIEESLPAAEVESGKVAIDKPKPEEALTSAASSHAQEELTAQPIIESTERFTFILEDLVPEIPIVSAITTVEAKEEVLVETSEDVFNTTTLEESILAQLEEMHAAPTEEAVILQELQPQKEDVVQQPATVTPASDIPVELVEVPEVQEENRVYEKAAPMPSPQQEHTLTLADIPVEPVKTYPKASSAPKRMSPEEKQARQERLERWKSIREKRNANTTAQDSDIALDEQPKTAASSMQAPRKAFESPRGMTEAEKALRAQKIERWRAAKKEQEKLVAASAAITDSFWEAEDVIVETPNATLASRALTSEERKQRQQKIQKWKALQKKQASLSKKEVELEDSFWSPSSDTGSLSHRAFVASKELAQDKKQRLKQWQALTKKRKEAKAIDAGRASLDEYELLEQVSANNGASKQSTVVIKNNSLTSAQRDLRMQKLMQWRRGWLTSL